ncbi:hypothetical protein J4211_01735 [Candidatus Woesearchaeota archaeon]|nr:hypothetical protein [Candidatus Woesearchaeota archaeon]
MKLRAGRTMLLLIAGVIVFVFIVLFFTGQQFVDSGPHECPGRCYMNSEHIKEIRSEADQVPPLVLEHIDIDGTADCDPNTETKLSGITLPRELPKLRDSSRWRCDSCCIKTN